MKAAIFLVEDHLIYREGVVNYINEEPDLYVCGEADDGASALAGIEQADPSLVIVDWCLKGSGGVDLLVCLRRRWPQLPVLILLEDDAKSEAKRAVQTSVCGYVMKDDSPEIMMEAIRTVLRGERYASKRAEAKLFLR